MLEQLFQPQDVFVNYFCTLPIQLLYSYLCQWVCPMRSKRLYWIVVVVIAIPYTVLRPVLSQQVHFATGVFVGLILPLLLGEGRWTKRLFSVGCMFFVLMAGEAVGGSVWVLAAGLQASDNAAAYRNAPLFVFICLASVSLQITLAVLLKKAIARVFPAEAPVVEGNEGSSGSRAERLLFLAAFPALQAVIMALLLYIAETVTSGDPHHMAVFAALVAGAFVMDVIVFWQIQCYRETQRAEQEGALLELQVREYLAEAGDVQDRLSALARFRHDLRNNVSVVQHLCEAGRLDEAGEYLQALRSEAGEL